MVYIEYVEHISKVLSLESVPGGFIINSRVVTMMTRGYEVHCDPHIRLSLRHYLMTVMTMVHCEALLEELYPRTV